MQILRSLKVYYWTRVCVYTYIRLSYNLKLVELSPSWRENETESQHGSPFSPKVNQSTTFGRPTMYRL